MHIEQIYRFSDLLSMRMTDLLLIFLCEFGWVTPKVTYCIFHLITKLLRFDINFPRIMHYEQWFSISHFLNPLFPSLLAPSSLSPQDSVVDSQLSDLREEDTVENMSPVHQVVNRCFPYGYKDKEGLEQLDNMLLRLHTGLKDTYTRQVMHTLTQQVSTNWQGINVWLFINCRKFRPLVLYCLQ